MATTVSEDLGLELKEKLRATALGFVRKYATLIKHRSDYNIARRYDLLLVFSGEDDDNRKTLHPHHLSHP